MTNDDIYGYIWHVWYGRLTGKKRRRDRWGWPSTVSVKVLCQSAHSLYSVRLRTSMPWHARASYIHLHIQLFLASLYQLSHSQAETLKTASPTHSKVRTRDQRSYILCLTYANLRNTSQVNFTRYKIILHELRKLLARIRNRRVHIYRFSFWRRIKPARDTR